MKMNLQTLTKDLCAYNLWANNELVNRLTENKEGTAAVSTELPHINQKLSRLLAVEEEWMEKITGKEQRSPEEKIFEGAIDALLKDLVVQSEHLLQYVSGLSEDTLKEKVSFDIPGSGDFNMTRYEMIQHTVGDSTHCRGEIVIS
ncbi:DinB family protein [Pedobacter caeni]|uniref:Uncharacterized damage-inducible protein DinB (Forms a four-helix bundle) n=1 Tax=Pedobacter caeni TaxID=288992 RepID=A0A1M5JGQ0_9SPHI|nr:DinB family protein [Pedobacter caeni]SHG39575.1 Uncharacterized damage-inducible protein DinB (forms a four-helix bundle) [Pedobacter caeni]